MEEKYGAVSFSGDTKAGPFHEQILSGRKTLTLRRQRKDGRPHVKPGYAFTMYWEVRKRKEDKPIHYIGMAECFAYESVRIVDCWNDEEFAKSDGFQDLDEFRDNWFPGWREMPWLNDVLKAYHNLKEEKQLVEDLMASWDLHMGKSTIMEFLQLKYMMIRWKYPLVDRGTYKEG